MTQEKTYSFWEEVGGFLLGAWPVTIVLVGAVAFIVAAFIDGIFGTTILQNLKSILNR